MTHHPTTHDFDKDLNDFRLCLLGEDSIPLKVIVPFSICKTKTEFKLIWNKLKKEDICTQEQYLNLVMLAKKYNLEADYKHKTFLERLGVK